MHKSFVLRDLLAGEHASVYPHAVPKTFRQRLGERYIVHRNTVAKMSVQKAKLKLKRDRSVVEDIEAGAGNPGISMFEDYAVTLGTSFETICFEAIAEAPRQVLDPDERLIIRTYQDGTPIQREAIRALVRSFRPDAVFPQANTAPPAKPSGVVEPMPAPDARGRTRRGRQ